MKKHVLFRYMAMFLEINIHDSFFYLNLSYSKFKYFLMFTRQVVLYTWKVFRKKIPYPMENSELFFVFNTWQFQALFSHGKLWEFLWLIYWIFTIKSVAISFLMTDNFIIKSVAILLLKTWQFYFNNMATLLTFDHGNFCLWFLFILKQKYKSMASYVFVNTQLEGNVFFNITANHELVVLYLLYKDSL